MQIKGHIHCNTLYSSRLVDNYWAIILNVKINVKNINNERYIIILNPIQKVPHDFCRGEKKLPHHFTTLDESSPIQLLPQTKVPWPFVPLLLLTVY